MFFTNDFLKVDASTEIPLKYVESIQFSRGEDLTADALKGDRTFRVRMLSGIEYVISVSTLMNEWQLDHLKRLPANEVKSHIQEYLDGIVKQWKFNVTGVKDG